ncbi:hypothetical protein [Azohydromonas caseinilytica]|uniref:Outer membrane protein n=1 Tax=Azohydromonas caseinilytica TaxID=2728836 RepID=A0A848FAC1_9BURK|nr:hypothetical protein [Azohydromonas caseinilytica]NML15816.1 hypothetical protein [Azohydromonas caseinilytica]
MNKAIVVCAMALVTGCSSMPASVNIALEKEAAAINAVEADYKNSVNMYHAELVKMIDGRLADIFRYEIEKLELSGKKMTAADINRLETQRTQQRATLVAQANLARDRYLNSRNLEILKALHAKVMQYSASDKFTAGDFSTLLTQIDADLSKIDEEKSKKGN